MTMPAPTAPTPTLTDRYVHAALRGVPDGERADLETELRTAIADASEDRVTAGDSPGAAERATLTELGDPTVLSARYRGRPPHLIGPQYYPDWLRLVRLLLVSVLPVVIGVSIVVNLLTADSVGAGFGAVVGTIFGAGLTVGIHLVFWPTLLFVILERTGATDLGMAGWTVDRLPVPGAGARLTEMLTSVTFALLIAGAIVWQQVVGFVRTDGVVVPLLPEALWTFWIPLYLVGLALSAGAAVAKYRTGRVTPTILAALLVGLVLNFAPGIVLALQHRLLEPRFFSAQGLDVSGPAWDALHTITALALAGALAWSLVDAVRQHRRDRRFVGTAAISGAC